MGSNTIARAKGVEAYVCALENKQAGLSRATLELSFEAPNNRQLGLE